MWHSRSLFCLTLLLYGAFGECFGIALVPKDKRGWTLNSAGYLLGPHAQQTLLNREGLAGKRDAMEDLYSVGPDSLVHAAHSADDHILQILMDFLSYLNLQGLLMELGFRRVGTGNFNTVCPYQRATSRLPLRPPEESM